MVHIIPWSAPIMLVYWAETLRRLV